MPCNFLISTNEAGVFLAATGPPASGWESWMRRQVLIGETEARSGGRADKWTGAQPGLKVAPQLVPRKAAPCTTSSELIKGLSAGLAASGNSMGTLHAAGGISLSASLSASPVVDGTSRHLSWRFSRVSSGSFGDGRHQVAWFAVILSQPPLAHFCRGRLVPPPLFPSGLRRLPNLQRRHPRSFCCS